MPSIGSFSFPVDDGLDSGIALLLAKPPDKELSLTYGGNQILAGPGTPYVICRFAGAHCLEDAFKTGSFAAQEGLDILSMTGQADLVTREADDEHLAWWCSEGIRTMALVSTVTLPVTLGHVTATVRDADGNAIPQTPLIPKHHIGFRFYRLSQVSDDLYDAYRNMYLAFESMLSSQYPKTKGLEINWLRQSLDAASPELQLVNLVPKGTSDVTDYLLAKIYDGARLPLFHAKDGKAYFAPVQSTSNRQEVGAALSTLTQIVICMAGKWYSARRRGGWVNVKLFEEQHEQLFAGSRFVFTDNPDFSLQDDLNSKSITDGVSFPGSFSRFFGSEQRNNLSGQLRVSAIASRGRFHAVYIVNDTNPLVAVSPDTTVDLNGLDVFDVHLFVRITNGCAPKYIYPR